MSLWTSEERCSEAEPQASLVIAVLGGGSSVQSKEAIRKMWAAAVRFLQEQRGEMMLTLKYELKKKIFFHNDTPFSNQKQ